MRAPASRRWWPSRKLHFLFDGQGDMKRLPLVGIICIVMLLFVAFRTTYYRYPDTEIRRFRSLPRGIIEETTNLELQPLWTTTKSTSKKRGHPHYLLAMPVGIKQKQNVDSVVEKFLPENFTVILFHYDENVDGWWDLRWSREAIHVVGHNQTKWWFAKRFLHPAVVSMYDYIFLWDEDLGVESFHPGRYIDIIKSEGLEISQPALDPNSTDIHHRITVRNRMHTFHRRVDYDPRGSIKCLEDSEGPPCTGFVEGMAPVFSRSAWHCAWHLIQSDLVHGWGMDMKLGYCAQGDRTQKVGIVDSEYVIHQGIQTLGSTSKKKKGNYDVRVEIRRQSMNEFQTFRRRWERAVEDDKKWIDPYSSSTSAT